MKKNSTLRTQWFLIPCVLIGLSLAGCIPVMLIGGTVVGGAVVYDKRSVSKMMQDQQIEYQIQFKLDRNQNLAHQTHINVDMFDGVVLLTGQVHSNRQRQRAQNIAKRFKYVRYVHNRLVVAPPTSLKVRAHDTWLTTRVKSVLLAHEGLKATRIKVITENGVVFLLGAVRPYQAHIASQLVRTMDAVDHVVTLLDRIH